MLQKRSETKNTPVVFTVENNDNDDIAKAFELGAVDGLTKPFKMSEMVARCKIRLAESKLRRPFTPIEYFFGEAQEKEGGKRTGVFKFYNNQTQQQIGEIYIEEGRVVFATYKNMIKEDAFLQLSSQKNAGFTYEDLSVIPKKTFSASLMSLMLDAAKIIDELQDKQQEAKKVMIIDKDRVPRIVASRILSNEGFAATVLGIEDLNSMIIDKIKPDVMVIDHLDGESIMDKIWPEGHGSQDVPVIIYTTKDTIERVEKIGKHTVDGLVVKSQSQQSLVSEVKKILNL
jgi:DNA-binding response OmpR family regulator